MARHSCKSWDLDDGDCGACRVCTIADRIQPHRARRQCGPTFASGFRTCVRVTTHRDIYLALKTSVPVQPGARPTKDTDIGTTVEDLLTGQYAQPLQVVAFNPVERCSRFKEIAEELDPRISAEGREVSEGCSVPRDRPLPVSPLRF
jgi:hypothetical protein